jgi:RNA polymerase-binding protein DksA
MSSKQKGSAPARGGSAAKGGNTSAPARGGAAGKPSPAKAPAKGAKSGARPSGARGSAAPNGAPEAAAAPPKKRGRSGNPRLGARSVAEVASAGKADPQGYVFVNGRRVRMISTKGQAKPRKTRAPRGPAAEQDEEIAHKPVKTKLSPKDLRAFRDLLLEQRAELVGDLNAMEKSALSTHGGNLSNLPIHMADIGTDTYDQDFTLSLAEAERRRLKEIDEALRRIEDKTYGICQMTGKPIPKARLKAKPWAKYTIEAARKLEGGLPY